MTLGLMADESSLSLGVAAAGSAAALLSVVIAWFVQRDVFRQRRRQDLESAIQQAVFVQWAAHHEAHYWGEPLANFQATYDRVRHYRLKGAEALADHAPPSEEESKWLPEAQDVERLAVEAIRELRQKLATLP